MAAMAPAALPPDHELRQALAHEVHARPHEALRAPVRASYLVVLVEPADRERERAHVAALCEDRGASPPAADAIHFSAELGAFRLRWERHNEFSTYTFIRNGLAATPFAEAAIEAVPASWRGQIPGRLLVASHAELQEARGSFPPASEVSAAFGGRYVVGSAVGGGAAAVFTDFRIHEDGFGRFLVIDQSLSRYQAGRTLQRLFEIEAYRMMALLALPLAREIGPALRDMERELGTVAAELAAAGGGEESLLEHVTGLAARVESAIGRARYRFGATRAYHDLVRARVQELREVRLPGLQTIEEFMSRRLAPAIATCESTARRLVELSERVSQASALLSTRVDVARERQNQQLLASMDRRARLQLRLQETVEGLSIAAITYYLVGLVTYAAKGLKAAGVHLDTDLASAVAIPVVAVLAALGVRHVRRRIAREQQAKASPQRQ